MFRLGRPRIFRTVAIDRSLRLLIVVKRPLERNAKQRKAISLLITSFSRVRAVYTAFTRNCVTISDRICVSLTLQQRRRERESPA